MTKKRYVRVTKIEDNEKDFLTVGKLYAVQHIDDEGDFHIIDDEDDQYVVDKWNSELVEGKEVVKCTELLFGDRDKFVVGDLYEVLSTDSDGDIRVKDKNGNRTLLVKVQFERVYAPEPEPEAAPVVESSKKYVRVTRLTDGDKVRKDFILDKIYEVLDTAWGSDVVVTDEHGKRGLLIASQIEYVEKPTSHVRVKELVGYDHERRNFTVGNVYKVVRKTERDNFIVIDDNGAESVLIKRQVEHAEEPKPAAKTEYVRVTRLLPVDKRRNNFTVGKVYEVIGKVDRHVRVIDDKGERMVLASYQIEYVEEPFKKRVRVTRLLSIDKTRKNFKLGHTYEVVEEDISGCHVIVIDEQGERAALISSQYEPIVAAQKATELTVNGRKVSSLVFNPMQEAVPVKTKIKVVNPSGIDRPVMKKGDVFDVIRETEHSYIVAIRSTGTWHVNKERAIEINY